MINEDEEFEKLKMELIYKGAKELSQKNMINNVIGEEEWIKLNFEYRIFLRYYIKNRCPIKCDIYSLDNSNIDLSLLSSKKYPNDFGCRTLCSSSSCSTSGDGSPDFTSIVLIP